MAEWVVCLTRNSSVLNFESHQRLLLFPWLEQETLPSLLSTGCFQDRFEHDFTIKLN